MAMIINNREHDLIEEKMITFAIEGIVTLSFLQLTLTGDVSDYGLCNVKVEHKGIIRHGCVVGVEDQTITVLIENKAGPIMIDAHRTLATLRAYKDYGHTSWRKG